MDNIDDTPSKAQCQTEPWGRYSASGGLYRAPVDLLNSTANGEDSELFLYSFGGDTTSDADNLGGVVQTNFRFSFRTHCWERLNDSPVEIGYRATVTTIPYQDNIYVVGGSNLNRRALMEIAQGQVWEYSLPNDAWNLRNFSTTAIDAEGGVDFPPPRWKHAAVAVSEHQVLITGGRMGSTVHNDAWILNLEAKSWTRLQFNRNSAAEFPRVYRHGMAYNPATQIVYIYGGLDETLSRHPAGKWWTLNLTSLEIRLYQQTQTETTAAVPVPPPPPPLASHAMEFVPEAQAVIMWSGTCSDDSDFYLLDTLTAQWCTVKPASRPDRRDAAIWALNDGKFYIAQGDSICYNGQVLPIADVHVFELNDFSSIDTIGNGAGTVSWNMLYEPYNARGTGDEPYCNGNNAGNCQPRPIVMGSTDTQTTTTCSPQFLARFAAFTNDTASTDQQGPTEFTALTFDNFSSVVGNEEQSSQSTDMPSGQNQQLDSATDGEYSSAPPMTAMFGSSCYLQVYSSLIVLWFVLHGVRK